MAPSATETITVPQPLLKLHSTQSGTGDYKQLQAHSVDRDAEEGKKEGIKAAKVRDFRLCPTSLAFACSSCTSSHISARPNVVRENPQQSLALLTLSLQPQQQYANYLPTWDPSQKYPPLTPFEHYEHGQDADLSFKDLLPADSEVVDLTPSIGSEVRGVQLSQLSSVGKDQLARFVAERKVVAFRGQDFAGLPIKDALEWGGYFGRHHVHPTSGSPAGYPEVHLVHRAEGDKSHESFFETRTSSVAWHSDVSYEAQPPGTTFLYILDKPETGGDTLFVDAAEAYKRLSPLFQERLHGLQAVHSGIEQVNAAVSRGSIVRREPVYHAHPIVRTHPATGEKAIYVNPQCECVHCRLEGMTSY